MGAKNNWMFITMSKTLDAARRATEKIVKLTFPLACCVDRCAWRRSWLWGERALFHVCVDSQGGMTARSWWFCGVLWIGRTRTDSSSGEGAKSGSSSLSSVQFQAMWWGFEMVVIVDTSYLEYCKKQMTVVSLLLWTSRSKSSGVQTGVVLRWCLVWLDGMWGSVHVRWVCDNIGGYAATM